MSPLSRHRTALLVFPAVLALLLPRAARAAAAGPETAGDTAPARAAAAGDPGPPAPDLAQLLAEAERRNPEVLAARARVEAASRVPSQAGSLPDPWLRFGLANASFGDWTLGEEMMAGLSVGWEQELPARGKRPLMAEEASREARVAEEQLRGVLLGIGARIRSARADLYRLDATHAILDEGRTLLAGLEATARNLYASGGGALADVLRAQAERGRLEAEVAGIEAEREAQVAILNRLAGRDPREPLGQVLSLAREPLPAPPDELPERVLAGAAEPRVMEGMRRVLTTRSELARLEKKPDWMLMGRYTYRGSLHPMWEVGLGVRIPAWAGRKQDQAFLEARSHEAAAERDLEAARLEALGMLRETLGEWTRAERRLVLYDEGILSQARAAYDSSLVAYAAGRAAFEAVFSAYLAELEHKLARTAEAAARETAVARIEALVGGAS